MFLLAGFLMIVIRTEINSRMKSIFYRARADVEELDRKVRFERRKQIYEFEKSNSGWLWLERELEYSGLRRKFKRLSGGKYMVVNVMTVTVLTLGGSIIFRPIVGVGLSVCFITFEFFAIHVMKARNLQKVNDELPKFLDFLGNYSITSGELISIFSQISKYLKAPLGDVLEECEAESRLSGDSGAALLAMADKIEHPQFKQLITNLEITSRYSADFSNLVTDSRRSLREYIAQRRERRGMLREAAINMGLLLIMSFVVLLTVNMLIETSIWQVLFGTFVGHCSLIGTGIIILLFLGQSFHMSK